MELESVLQFLENKAILITGATGFLGKMLVEKVLRVQPNVKKLYLLIRASDNDFAYQRMHTEIIGKELFRVLRERWDTEFESFVSEKMAAVSGDISFENLGLDANDEEKLWKEIDIIINSAATTRFDGRYDVALDINTLGVLHVLGFAKKCTKLRMLVHISTAYVCGERDGVIQEDTIFCTGKTIKSTSKLDIKEEQKLVAEKLQELRNQNASEDTITTIMKEFGIKRAKLFGWPNTYVFTKAMGELCVKVSKENLPLIIIRPTVVTSTYKEPFPGWMEGFRTIDSIVVGHGKGKVKCFLANPMSIADLIPGDMVVNSIIVAMARHANQCCEIIYHIGSSMRNPIRMSNIRNFSLQYFTKNPLTNKKGKLIKVGNCIFFSNVAVFQAYMVIRFKLPLKILKLGNIASCHHFPDVHTDNNRKLKLMMRLIQLYKPYALFNGIFDDSNSENLRQKLREISGKEMETLNFDPKCIDWEDYMINTHFPGLVKYVIK
ncbi:fatty acyl-CoA reductase 3 [Ziziphus jujuba]|uniref:Fatty acyl-CoA reductase n=1 Tax=Ziziphus jujuba TaxID=326968 RepID=A0ABM3I714_ZIZJJ|nr:fatty acyl-CoA reductase 3 [Ziziphus jujuba]